MNKQDVLERLQLLRQQRTQLEHNVSAYNGAIQDCEYWLEVLEKAEAPKEEPKAEESPHEEGAHQES